MYDLSLYKAIDLSAHFKPRAEADLLSRVVQNAWEIKNKELEVLRDELHVIREIAALFRRLYPAVDMAVLNRYGKAEMLKTVSVSIYNPEETEPYGRYNLSTMIEMPEDEQCLIPAGSNHLYACGPRYSENPTFGVRPEKWETLTFDERKKIILHHTDADRRRLPPEIEVFFERVAESQNALSREYRQTTNWPALMKDTTGNYPTWEEIAVNFPVVGDYIRKIAETV